MSSYCVQINTAEIFGDRLFPLNVSLELPLSDKESFHPTLRVTFEFPLEPGTDEESPAPPPPPRSMRSVALAEQSSRSPSPSHSRSRSEPRLGSEGTATVMSAPMVGSRSAIPAGMPTASSSRLPARAMVSPWLRDPSLTESRQAQHSSCSSPSASFREVRNGNGNDGFELDLAFACASQAYLAITLPDSLFVDPSELGDKLALSVGVSRNDLSGEVGLVQGLQGGLRGWRVVPPVVDIERAEARNRYAHAEGAGEGEVAEQHTLWLLLGYRPNQGPSSHSANSVASTSSASQSPDSAALDSRTDQHALALGPDEEGDSIVHPDGTRLYRDGPNSRRRWQVDVPLHGRYLAPTSDPDHVGKRSIVFPGTGGSGVRAAWKCVPALEAIASWSEPVSWPDLTDIPAVHPRSIDITLPTGSHSHQTLVESITPLVIWAGWAWLIWKILRVSSRLRQQRRRVRRGTPEEEEEEEEEDAARVTAPTGVSTAVEGGGVDVGRSEK